MLQDGIAHQLLSPLLYSIITFMKENCNLNGYSAFSSSNFHIPTNIPKHDSRNAAAINLQPKSDSLNSTHADINS